MSTGMTAENIGRTGVAAIALLATLLLLLPASAAAGSCSTENRVDHRDAECLSAWWKNRGLLKKSPYHVSNQCPEYGKVVAKVDLVSARDRTIHLTDHIPRDGDTRHRIRGISCCSDMGICNRSDVVTDKGCLARFRRVSPARATCGLAIARAVNSGGNPECRISAMCESAGPGFMNPLTHVTVPWLDMDEVRNCRGELSRGPCRRPQPDASWVSVSDSRVEEAEGASLDFTVTLSRALSEPVTVRFATSDGTARAGSDYRATSGWLTFSPGQTEKTVSVSVLDDELDEGSETLTLTVWNLSPLHMSVADPTGTGTISNTDRMPKAWIARFGRTVVDQVLDAVDARMRAKPAPGGEVRLAGQRIGLGPPFGAGSSDDAAPGAAGSQDLAGWLEGAADPALRGFGSPARAPGHGRAATGRDLLPGSSFSLTAETGGKGVVSIWGGGAVTRYSGREPGPAKAGGDLAVDGEVASGVLGADWTRGRWTTGLLVTHSMGDGGYRGTGGPGSGSGTSGTVASTLTGVWPWLRHDLGARFSVWSVAGYGEGNLTLESGDADGARTGAIRTHLDLRMAAAGLRGVALDGGKDGLTLAVKTDAMIVRTASDAVSGAGGNLAGVQAEATRLRLALEGSRPFRLPDGSVLVPSMEIGVRRDGGDAETGLGADIGAGLAWTDPKRGLGAELRGRGLLTHDAKGFRRRGLAGVLSWDPVAGDRGPRLSLTRTLSVSEQGRAGALPGRSTPAGLAARFGYGFPAFGDRFTATPEIVLGLSGTGRDYSLGWRLVRGVGAPDRSALELAVEARRRESAYDRNAPPEHAIGFRATSRF